MNFLYNTISLLINCTYPGVKNVNCRMKQDACESLTLWYVMVARGALVKSRLRREAEFDMASYKLVIIFPASTIYW